MVLSEGLGNKRAEERVVLLKTLREDRNYFCLFFVTPCQSPPRSKDRQSYMRAKPGKTKGDCCRGALQDNMNHQSSSILQVMNLSLFCVFSSSLRLPVTQFCRSAAQIITGPTEILLPSDPSPCLYTWKRTHLETHTLIPVLGRLAINKAHL